MFEKKKKLSGVEKKAKMKVVEDMRDMASKAMGDKLHGLKKVTVASNSSEGLKEGLEKAEDVIESKESEGLDSMSHDMGHGMDHESEESEESESPESSEEDVLTKDLSKEEIADLIEQLQKKLEEKNA